MQKIIETSSHKEAAFKACMGIINLRKGFNDQRINNACKRAESFKDYSYRTIENILKMGLDRVKEDEEINGKTLPRHDNIRGKDFYKESDKDENIAKDKDEENEN